MENKSLPATQGSSNAGPQDPERIFCVPTVMTLSKHTPGSCCLRASVSSLFYWRRKKSPALLFSGFWFSQGPESKEHFVQAAKPALLSEAREVRLLGESLSQTIKEIKPHTAGWRRGLREEPSLTLLCLLSQGFAVSVGRPSWGWGWFSWQSACHTSTRPGVRPPEFTLQSWVWHICSLVGEDKKSWDLLGIWPCVLNTLQANKRLRPSK